jgi:hypothetical protein
LCVWDGFFWDRIFWTIFQGCLQTMILLISAFWVARITGMSTVAWLGGVFKAPTCIYLFMYLLAKTMFWWVMLYSIIIKFLISSNYSTLYQVDCICSISNSIKSLSRENCKRSI